MAILNFVKQRLAFTTRADRSMIGPVGSSVPQELGSLERALAFLENNVELLAQERRAFVVEFSTESVVDSRSALDQLRALLPEYDIGSLAPALSSTDRTLPGRERILLFEDGMADRGDFHGRLLLSPRGGGSQDRVLRGGQT